MVEIVEIAEIIEVVEVEGIIMVAIEGTIEEMREVVEVEAGIEEMMEEIVVEVEITTEGGQEVLRGVITGVEIVST